MQISAALIGDLMGNVSGGLRQGVRPLGRLDLGLTVAGDAYGLPGFTAFFDGTQTADGGFSERYAGDMQGVSNVDAPGGFLLYQAWVQKSWNDDATVKIGLIDLNSEFDVQEAGVVFVNSSFGIGAEYGLSGAMGPSIYPFPGLGVTGSVKLDDDMTFRAGVFDAVPRDPDRPRRFSFTLSDKDGALLTGEFDARLSDAVHLQIGAWNYTGGFDTLAAPSRSSHDNRGFYGTLTARLWQDGEHGPAVDGWVRGGTAKDSINPVSAYFGGGIVYTGPFAGRPNDQLGFAVANAYLGGPARDAAQNAGSSLPSRETTFELTYAAPVAEWLVVQPDVQYVVNPAGGGRIKDAFVVGLRLSISLSETIG